MNKIIKKSAFRRFLFCIEKTNNLCYNQNVNKSLLKDFESDKISRILKAYNKTWQPLVAKKSN